MYNNSPAGKYGYKRLPTGVDNSPYIFQQKINYLFRWFEFIRAYICNLLILTKGHRKDNLHRLELNLNNMKEKGLKYSIKK